MMTDNDTGASADACMAEATIRELARLVDEAAGRLRRGEYVEAMGSLTAIEPLRSLLLGHLSACWQAKEIPDATAEPAVGAYL